MSIEMVLGGGAFKELIGREGGALINDMNILRRDSLAFLPCQDTAEKSVTGRGLSLG